MAQRKGKLTLVYMVDGGPIEQTYERDVVVTMHDGEVEDIYAETCGDYGAWKIMIELGECRYIDEEHEQPGKWCSDCNLWIEAGKAYHLVLNAV